MPCEFVLTYQPVRATGPAWQLIERALDVSAYDHADVLLVVTQLEGTPAPSITVEVWTGMQLESDDGWVQAAAFTAVTSTNTVSEQRVAAPGLLKYLRWRVTAFAGGGAATFFISGMLRNH